MFNKLFPFFIAIYLYYCLSDKIHIDVRNFCVYNLKIYFISKIKFCNLFYNSKLSTRIRLRVPQSAIVDLILTVELMYS